MNEKIQQENDIVTIEGIAVKDLCEELKKITEEKELGRMYLTICACALEVIEKCLGENYDFPMDVEKIATELGAQIVYQPLNRILDVEDVQRHRVVGRNLKRINRITKQQISNILIDSESGRNEQRYALTHELAHFMIHYNENLYNNAYCIMPMLFKNMEEMVADIFATLMLIPVPIFLNEFMGYIGEQPLPVETSGWLKYLSIVAEVPYEYVAIGYQNIRYVCGILYDIKMKRSVKDVENYDEDSEKYTKDENMNSVIKKWTDRLLMCLTDEVVNKLFG